MLSLPVKSSEKPNNKKVDIMKLSDEDILS